VAPWTVVPSDSKLHRNLMIASLVNDALEDMGLQTPAADPELTDLRVD